MQQGRPNMLQVLQLLNFVQLAYQTCNTRAHLRVTIPPLSPAVRVIHVTRRHCHCQFSTLQRNPFLFVTHQLARHIGAFFLLRNTQTVTRPLLIGS